MKNLFEIASKTLIASTTDAQNWLVDLGDGSAFMPAGHNGPHFALESPVRNTSHWLVAFLIAQRITGDKRFADAIAKIRSWLVTENPYYRKDSYVLRQRGNQDWCNGVIGHAWVLEAFARLGRYENDELAISLAENIIENHRFDKLANAWRRHDPENERYGVDYTYDHQAWLAAAIGDLGQSHDVGMFLAHSNKKGFGVRESGRIKHILTANTPRGLAVRLRFLMREYLNAKWVTEIENAYQIYTLFPLARLYGNNSQHPLFQSEKFERALNYCTKPFLDSLNNTPYGFGYNAPGLELPMVYLAFHNRLPLSEDDVIDILEEQLNFTLSPVMNLLAVRTPDPMTLSARIYELGLFCEAYKDWGSAGDK